MACGQAPTNNTTGSSTTGAHNLTHTSQDAEYILSWNILISACPDLADHSKLEGFAGRGQTVQISPDESIELDANSPAAWADTRLVRVQPSTDSYRNFGVEVMYFDKPEYMNEYLQLLEQAGLSLQTEGDFKTGVNETNTPVRVLQLLLAGKQIAVSFTETSSTGQQLLCSKEELTGLFNAIEANISSLGITPLPSVIPGRAG